MITCQQGVNQGSTVSDRNPSPLMTISGGVWHTYDVTRPEHEIPRLGLKHPRGCVQQVDTSLVFNYLMMILSHSSHNYVPHPNSTKCLEVSLG